jgi:hypothetical protein
MSAGNTPDENLETHTPAETDSNEEELNHQETEESHHRDQSGRDSPRTSEFGFDSKAQARMRQVWSDTRISSNNVLMVLITLAMEMGDNDECSLTQVRLASLARIGKTALNRHLETALELGYFAREPGQGRSPSRYIAQGVWMD